MRNHDAKTSCSHKIMCSQGNIASRQHFAQKFVLHEFKIIRTHIGHVATTRPSDVHLLHFRGCVRNVTLSVLHIPATHTATCPLV